MFVYTYKRKSRFKNLRGQIKKILRALNPHLNFDSKYVLMLILALSATLESPTFEKTTFRKYVMLRNRSSPKF